MSENIWHSIWKLCEWNTCLIKKKFKKKKLTEKYFAADWKTNNLQPNSQKPKEIKPKPKMKQHTDTHSDFAVLAIGKWGWWKGFLWPHIFSLTVEIIIFLPKKKTGNRCLLLPGVIFPFVCCLTLWKPMVWRFPDQRMKCWINTRFIPWISHSLFWRHFIHCDAMISK